MIRQTCIIREESTEPAVYLDSLKRIRGILSDFGIEKIYNGHFSYEPIALPKLDTMVKAMEMIISGELEGVPVENHAGKGVEYSYDGWKVICRK